MARTRGTGAKNARGRKAAAAQAAATSTSAAASAASLAQAQAEYNRLNLMMIQKQQMKAAARGGGGRGRGRGGRAQQAASSKKSELNERSRIGPFIMWLNENRDLLANQNPDLAGLYLLIEAGKSWFRLSPAMRKFYDGKFRESSESAMQTLLEFSYDDFLDEYAQAKSYYDEKMATSKPKG